jgi:glycosyltransferase A (GT-A) superfamily protein (DUF2064 family)
MPHLLGEVTAVLMAKDPRHGGAKSRLSAGGCSAGEASQVAEVMLRCTAHRLRQAARSLFLAVTPDGAGQGLADRLGLEGIGVIDQGGGDLGQRLDRVWRVVGTEHPIAFFGGDTPDVPASLLSAIPTTLAGCDVAFGPTGDGGYWTLAARTHHPAVLEGIDWGSAHVYDQTRRKADGAGLVVRALPQWHDVDRPGDLDALRVRLRGLHDGPPGRPNTMEPLRWMAAQLDMLSPTRTPPENAPS